MSLVLNGSGTITGLSAGGLPDATITQPELATGVAGTGPAFSAYKSGSGQTVTAGVFTKVTYDVEDFDTNSNFASSRFTPTVAGYYQVSSTAYVQGGTYVTRCLIDIQKNGASVKFGSDAIQPASLTTEGRSTVSALIYLNGSTDYVEIFALVGGSGTMTLQTGQDNNWFTGFLARAA